MEARRFLDEPGRALCRCTPQRDDRSPLGWTVRVDEVRAVTWGEISDALDALGRDDMDRVACPGPGA